MVYAATVSALTIGLVIGFLLGARYRSGRHHRRQALIFRRR